MATKIYRGFSTANFLIDRQQGFNLTDQDLVKQDLLNHLYTVRGERVHQPNFGTRIPLLAFEPLDDTTLNIVREDITAVFEYDPRVKLAGLSVNAMPDNNMIVALVDIHYIELNTQETLKLEFNTKS